MARSGLTRFVAVSLLVGTHVCLVSSAQVSWCDSTPEDQRYEVFLGVETCIPLCAYVAAKPPPPPSPADSPEQERRRLLSEGADRKLLQSNLLNISRTEISHGYPDTYEEPFKYPYDEVNYPPSAALIGGEEYQELTKTYCFTPSDGEECTYTVCFQAEDLDGEYDPSDARCYRLDVYNAVLQFSGQDEAEYDQLNQLMKAPDGLTMSTWVYPDCSGNTVGNQTLMYFGSDRNYQTSMGTDEGLKIRHGLKWNIGADSETGSFYYTDCEIGAVFSPSQYYCGVWHYVLVTIASDSTGFLFVDGYKAGHELPTSQDEYTWSVTEFTTRSRVDDGADGTTDGIYRFGYLQGEGEGFIGMLDEMRVWNKPVSQYEAFKLMLARSADASVKSVFTMSTDSSSVTSPTTLGGAPEIVYKAIPSMIPCVLGMEHSVGPTVGDCTTEVYGWNFADGLMSQCSIAGMRVRATYVSDDVVKCDTPGHVSPRFSEVLATNDGTNFTDTTAAGKTVYHLYLESSLYLQGESTQGASADDVCEDFGADSLAVSVGTWVCPKCGPPQNQNADPAQFSTPCLTESC